MGRRGCSSCGSGSFSRFSVAHFSLVVLNSVEFESPDLYMSIHENRRHLVTPSVDGCAYWLGTIEGNWCAV